MKRIITLVLLAGAFASSLFAQNADNHVHDKRCGTMHRLEQLKADDPTLEGRMRNIESFTQNWIAQNSSNKTSAVVTIPVVVHIVYRTSAENISDAQVQSQIDVLNEDFRRLNADRVNTPSAFAGVAADPEVQFCLAVRDPNGNATSGITRTQTTKTSFSDNDGVKSSGGGGRAPWATDKYLNFWVCNLGGGLLGYAQFPGGPAATDGVVINYNYFGRNGSALSPYQLGRTATHETGHWLNLYHVWGDANCGNDQVSDTPTAADANYGCPTFPHKTCGNTTNGDMFMNYMDYVDDGCMNTFTAGQKSRMQALFATGGARVGLLSSQGCVPVNTTCGTPTGMAANSIAQTTATLNWAAVTGATSYNIRYRPVGSTTWSTTTSTTTSVAVAGLTAGTNYEFQVQAVCASGTGTYTTSATFTTLTATQTCSTPANLQTPTIGSTTVTVTWSAVTGAISYNVRIKLKTAVNWSTFNTTGTSLNVSNLTASSTYQVGVQAVCSASLSSAWSTTREFTTTAANACGTDSYEANNSLGAAKALTVNTNGLALICPSTDVDWYRFSNSTTMRNIRITATNLPADYDLDLYTADGVLLGTSDNAGTTSEGLIYNNAPVAVYYAKVYGYNGAYSNSLSYTVRADISATAFRYAEGAAPANGVIAELSNDAPAQSNITLYPNPTQQTLNCNYEAATHGNVKVKVIDLVGKTLLENNFDAKAGVNTLSVDVQNLSNGFYFLELTNGKERIVKKFQTLK